MSRLLLCILWLTPVARAFYDEFGFPCTAGDSDDWDLQRLEEQDRCFRQLQRTCKNDAAAMRAHAANPVRLVLENPYPHDHPRRLDFDHERAYQTLVTAIYLLMITTVDSARLGKQNATPRKPGACGGECRYLSIGDS